MKNEFQVIADLIEKDKKVLDVGCADGTLMKFLKDNKNINIRGLEISKEKVQECIAKGLTVIEGNAEKDLKQFPDKSFDYVVLSQTLQAFLNPELVLDVGCADGTLMKFLKDNKNINIRGLEISKEKVQECIAKGLTVIEGNAEKDLKQFPDKSFDYVVLSQTLQAFLNPELVLDELLRVGKKAIVTIPNFEIGRAHV